MTVEYRHAVERTTRQRECRGPAVDARRRRSVRRTWLDPGDIDEALNAANAIGDDRLQRQIQGTVVPDSLTHGTSARRIRWFRAGFESGDFSAADQLFELPYERL